MIRDIPTLQEHLLKQYIAKLPGKCMTEPAIERFLVAAKDPKFFPNSQDVVQEVVSTIVHSGRMTDDAVPVIIFRGRRSINLSNSRLSGKYMVRLLDHCESVLESLDVSGCFQVANDNLSSILTRCPMLRRLNVKNCRKVNDMFLYEITKLLALKLIALDLGGNFNITDEGVRFFLKNYRHIATLESISLSGLSISDETVLLLLQQCTGLLSLSLAYLDLKESTILQVLQVLGKQLEQLDLSWPSTTPNSRNTQPSSAFLIEHIPALCPMLTVLDLTANRNLQLPHVQEIIERKLTYQTIGSGKPLETFAVKFIATPKTTLEAGLKYPNLKLLF